MWFVFPTILHTFYALIQLHNLFSECFILIAGHIIDVHIHPTGTCEEDNAILVGYHSGSSYTFTEEDAGTKVFFGCDVGQRCETGQSVIVEVAELLQVSAVERGVDSAANRKGLFSALALRWSFPTALRRLCPALPMPRSLVLLLLSGAGAATAYF